MNAVSLPASAHDAQPCARPSPWRKLVHEPLLHFVFVGTAIFVTAHLIEADKRDSQATVVVDHGLRQRLANLYLQQFGVTPTSGQLQTIVDDYVDDEVLYREALRLGLDQDDEIIRRRLVQKLEFLQRDSIAAAEPPPQQLRAYYESHRAQFETGARVTFTHLYFNPDRGGDAQALARARQARADLLAHGDSADGDAFPLESPLESPLETNYTALTRHEATRVFGTSNFVDALFTSPKSQWSPPVRSGLGWHLIKVTAIEAPHRASLDEVLPEVRAAYLQVATTRARREQLDALRTRYHVVSRAVAP